MEKILGYGEDALTLWYLTRQLPAFLEKMKKEDGCQATPEQCLLLYRPSLGRGGKCYGEFDAIVATPKTAYLIESKWVQSGNEHKLKGEQGKRHQIFRS